MISLFLSYFGITKDSFSAMQLLSLVLQCRKQIISLQVKALRGIAGLKRLKGHAAVDHMWQKPELSLVPCNSSSAALQQTWWFKAQQHILADSITVSGDKPPSDTAIANCKLFCIDLGFLQMLLHADLVQKMLDTAQNTELTCWHILCACNSNAKGSWLYTSLWSVLTCRRILRPWLSASSLLRKEAAPLLPRRSCMIAKECWLM